MLVFVNGIYFKNGVEEPLQQQEISIYKVTNSPEIIGAVSINNEMTTPEIHHDVTTPTPKET